MTSEELHRRIDQALQLLNDTERTWGQITIDIERGEPRHVNVTFEVKNPPNSAENMIK